MHRLKLRFHILESKHCPASSDCRELISKPLPYCQAEVLYKMFDENFRSDIVQCHCCYSCIRRHASDGCEECIVFIKTFFKNTSTKRRSKPVMKQLKDKLHGFFKAIRIDSVIFEGAHSVSVHSFVKDFLTMTDEITSADDIANLWHIESGIACKVYSVYSEVMHGTEVEEIHGFDTEIDDVGSTVSDEEFEELVSQTDEWTDDETSSESE